ncbi:Endochitinase 1 [Bulinus truncatus]|nr:Endochitinase 1 [Bulinus truncatus]
MNLSISLVLFFYMVNTVIACEIKACYYHSDAAFRPYPYYVKPEMLNPQHCTVMIYAFAIIQDNKLKNYLTAEEDTPWSKGLYSKFVELKSSYKHLTMLLSVEGWNFGSKHFSDMSSTPETRKIFIDNTITFLRERNFDGLHVQWEFKATYDGSPSYKSIYILLIQEMKAIFERESNLTGRPRLKLTAALVGDVRKYPESYEIDKIAKELDFVGIMTYDYSLPYSTMHPSPIYGDSAEDTLNINYTVEYYLQRGVPKNKMIIGLPMYGRGYKTKDKKYNTPEFGGIASSYATRLYSTFAYFEMCRFVESGCMVSRHQGVPYMTIISQYWLGFEDTESVKQKVMFAKRHGLAGVMVWSLDMDDVQKKFCRKPTKNLIETIQETCASEVAISSVDPPLPDEDARLLWPYTHPYPLRKRPKSEIQSSDAEAIALCKAQKGVVIIPYPGIDCKRYVHCYFGIGYVQTCSDLKYYDPEVNNFLRHVYDVHDFDGHDYDGHDFNGHDYDGSEYDEHDYDGHDFNGHDYDGHDYDGSDYDEHDYDGHDCDGHDYDGHDNDGCCVTLN